MKFFFFNINTVCLFLSFFNCLSFLKRIMFLVKNISLHMTHISQRLFLQEQELSGILSYLFPRQGQDKVSFPGHVSRKSVVRAWHFGYLREMSRHVPFSLHPNNVQLNNLRLGEKYHGHFFNKLPSSFYSSAIKKKKKKKKNFPSRFVSSIRIAFVDTPDDV